MTATALWLGSVLAAYLYGRRKGRKRVEDEFKAIRDGFRDESDV